MGVDLMLELDARAVDPMRAVTRRFQLPKGPTGVAVSDAANVAVVWGQFDEALAVIPLGGGSTKTIDAYQGVQTIDADTALGRDLFYRSEDARITFDGVACSSCHPDGGEDGVTWSTPEGMRQTPMLAGRLHGTAPYGWTRKQGTLEEYIADTSTRLGGSGLDPTSLKALAKFAKNLPTPPRSSGFERRLFDNALFDKGRDVFFAEGCGTCHVGGPGTDAKSHVVTPDGGEGHENEFDTPSLVRIGLTPPYFHDGRYQSLDDLLFDPNSKMGNTAKLDEEERKALKLYLESL
jgi:cytochrome c peroxidase